MKLLLVLLFVAAAVADSEPEPVEVAPAAEVEKAAEELETKAPEVEAVEKKAPEEDAEAPAEAAGAEEKKVDPAALTKDIKKEKIRAHRHKNEKKSDAGKEDAKPADNEKNVKKTNDISKLPFRFGKQDKKFVPRDAKLVMPPKPNPHGGPQNGPSPVIFNFFFGNGELRKINFGPEAKKFAKFAALEKKNGKPEKRQRPQKESKASTEAPASEEAAATEAAAEVKPVALHF